MDIAMPMEQFVKRKKMVTWISRLLIVLAFFLVFVGIPEVNADNDNTLQKQWVEDIVGGILPIITETISGTGSEGTSGYHDFYSRVTGHDGALRSVLVALIIIGAAFCVVVAFTHFMQAMERGGDMVENVWKFLFELFIAMFFIMNTQRLIEIADDIGETILLVATSTATEEASAIDPEVVLESLTGAKTGSTLWQFGTLVKLFLPWALSQLVKIAAKFAILQLLFEMGIRYALTPLFIADIYHEGLRSPGMRHLKQYLGVYIKLLICIIVSVLGQDLVLTAMTGIASTSGVAVSNSLFEIIAINLTCVGVMMKGGEYVNTFTQ